MAMKNNDVWGVFCNGSQYWLFKGYSGPEIMTGVELPGENSSVIDLTDSGVDIDPFLVLFDHFGKPYSSYSNPDVNNPVSVGSPKIIIITSAEDDTLNRKLTITPETGFVVATQ
jgi:hypothetical protein